jgi:hypothetical protein
MLIGIEPQADGEYHVLQGSEVVAHLTIPADPRDATIKTLDGHTLSWAAVGFIGIYLKDIYPWPRRTQTARKPRTRRLGDSLSFLERLYGLADSRP